MRRARVLRRAADRARSRGEPVAQIKSLCTADEKSAFVTRITMVESGGSAVVAIRGSKGDVQHQRRPGPEACSQQLGRRAACQAGQPRAADPRTRLGLGERGPGNLPDEYLESAPVSFPLNISASSCVPVRPI